ncbi:hypothetical protein GCM10023224_36360 [Streptomonospora halophila]|uniref:SalK n=1 Tax=Streptomonospora halophila TaxID=427369 RepID=A0ABP9GQT5_9ACTN
MPDDAPSPELARTAWSALEPIHIPVYFAPEARERYAAIGLDDRALAYFASRSAAMGAVDPGTVTAAFYSFSPALVGSAIPRAWSLAAPETVLRTRLDVADQVLRRVLGEDAAGSERMKEAAGLARTAAEAAAGLTPGRPLFAGHAGLEWPGEPHTVLWHAATLLREFRGDGHIATLVDARLAPLEALATHAATGAMKTSFLRRSRGWSEEEWAEGIRGAVGRGLVTADPEGALALTEAGRTLRADLETRTDVLSAGPYAAIGARGCERLAELTAPFAEAFRAEGLVPGSRSRT